MRSLKITLPDRSKRRYQGKVKGNTTCGNAPQGRLWEFSRWTLLRGAVADTFLNPGGEFFIYFCTPEFHGTFLEVPWPSEGFYLLVSTYYITENTKGRGSNQTLYHSITFHSFPYCSMMIHNALWHSTTFYKVPSHSMTFYDLLECSGEFRGIPGYSTRFHHIPW